MVDQYVPASASPDLPVVQEWIGRNPDAQAKLTSPQSALTRSPD
jgi:hypothetical protein